MISVKILKIGAVTVELALAIGSTIADLFNAEGCPYDMPDSGLTINGNNATGSARLNDGDRVFIGEKVKGNADVYEVKLSRIGGQPVAIAAEGRTTLQTLFDGMTDTQKSEFLREDGTDKYDYKIGGTRVIERDTAITDADAVGGVVLIYLSQKVKGNN